MPFKSSAQNAWAHTKAGTKALGGKKKVKEWDKDTNYENLPEHVEKESAAPKPKPRMRQTRQSIPR